MRDIEEKRVAAIAAYKKELLIALHLDVQMNDREFYKLIKKKGLKKNPFFINFKNKYKNIDSILNDEELALSDSHAFLENIYIAFFSSGLLPVLYKKEMDDEIFSSFFVDHTLTLTAEIFCHKKILEPLQKVISERRNTSTWIKLHAVSGKQTLKDDCDRSLLDVAAREGDLIVFKEL